MASSSSIISNISASKMRNLVGSIALSNQYQVNFSALPSNLNKHFTDITFKDETGFDFTGFLTGDLGLLCCDATLPSSSYATSEVKDNFIGISQEFAHTRLYTDVDFSFYVDQNYNVLRFFEGWMDYISGGNSSTTSPAEPAASSVLDRNIYRRFNYPNDYKIDTLTISKFNRDYFTSSGSSSNRPSLFYQFVNAFPKSLTSIPISYGSAEILKVTVSINYDRYIVSKEVIQASSTTSSD